MPENVVRPLLAVKRMIPPVPAGAVDRDRLVSRLRGADTRLTLVVAPAGWGKTRLLSGWAADPGEGGRVAWLSLDETDDEPRRFWTYVFTALGEVGDGLGAESLTALDRPAVEVALPLLLNELAASPVRHVLVLDDYHALADPRIHEEVEYLLTYLPPALRLVIAGRTDPPLPVARLRARGELTELRASELRFRADEAQALVSAVSGRPVDAATATAVWRRTEGWAAGLQLAGLALRTDPAMARGDERHLMDYFAAEVLPALAPAQRDLLVRAAPLDLLSGPLCDAALGVTGSAAVLEELVRADLFVSALDDERRWYRCHRLLRDALNREATSDGREVLGRAAVWFADQGRMDDAADSLLRARRPTEAARLLEESAHTWFFPRGAPATFLRLGERLPRSAVGPGLAYDLAYAAALCDDRAGVNRWLDVAETGDRDDVVRPGWHSFRAAVLCARATFGVAETEFERAVELAEEAVRLETADGRAGHPTVRPMLGSVLARAGRFDEAVAVLLPSWGRPERESWPPWNVLNVGSVLAISLIETGRPDECDRVLRDARPAAAEVERDRPEAYPPGLALLGMVEGRRRYQNGEVEAAVTALRRAVERAERLHRPSGLIRGLVYLADAELAGGDPLAARTALSRARDVLADEPVSATASALLDEAEVRMGRRTARAARRSGVVAEELTDRELSILRALQGSATQREIGSALFLSINTVKAYTKSLYRKLGVASRQDAVTAARELGLI